MTSHNPHVPGSFLLMYLIFIVHCCYYTELEFEIRAFNIFCKLSANKLHLFIIDFSMKTSWLIHSLSSTVSPKRKEKLLHYDKHCYFPYFFFFLEVGPFYITQSDLELTNSPSPPSEYWDHKHVHHTYTQNTIFLSPSKVSGKKKVRKRWEEKERKLKKNQKEENEI